MEDQSWQSVSAKLAERVEALASRLEKLADELERSKSSSRPPANPPPESDAFSDDTASVRL